MGRTIRRILLGGLVTAGLIGGVAVVAGLPDRADLIQAAEEPLVDDCGVRPPKPTTTTTTSPSTTTTSTSTTTIPTSTSTSTSTSVPEPAPSTSVPGTLPAPEMTPTTGAVAAPVEDTHWRCTLVEEFEGTELRRDRWAVQTTTAGDFGVGGECVVDDPDNVSVSDGTLKLRVLEEEAPVPCPRRSDPGFTTPYTAGSIITRQELDQAFGRYEIRARMPRSEVPGLHFAFWLWPRDLMRYPPSFGAGDYDKWTNGEIDVIEWYSRFPYHQVPYLHYAHTYVQTGAGKWVPNDPNTTKACLVGYTWDWHTYVLEWTPSVIRIVIDGKVCLENQRWTPRNTTMPGPFDQPFMVSLSQGLGAIGTQNQFIPGTTPLPATAEVDYLKIWQ